MKVIRTTDHGIPGYRVQGWHRDYYVYVFVRLIATARAIIRDYTETGGRKVNRIILGEAEEWK